MKNKKLILLIIFTFIVLAGYTLFFIELRKKNIEFEKIRAEIEAEDTREAKLRILGKDIAETEEERALIKNAFIPPLGEVVFVEKIETLAKSLGADLSINSLEIKESGVEGVEKLSIKMKAEGSWSEVYKFLVLLQNMPESTVFSRYALSAEDSTVDKNKKNMWTLSADLDVLKLK